MVLPVKVQVEGRGQTNVRDESAAKLRYDMVLFAFYIIKGGAKLIYL